MMVDAKMCFWTGWAGVEPHAAEPRDAIIAHEQRARYTFVVD